MNGIIKTIVQQQNSKPNEDAEGCWLDSFNPMIWAAWKDPSAAITKKNGFENYNTSLRDR